MYHEKFYFKKQLLAQRDDTLAEIGLRVFETGKLPESFEMLPQEFYSMEILMTQLNDRYRTLKEERDRIYMDGTAIMHQLAEVEAKYDKKLQEPKRQVNELHLKIDYTKDQLKHSGRKQRKSEHLFRFEQELAEILPIFQKLESDYQKERTALQEQLAPLQDRKNMLDAGIRKVGEEEDHLRISREKRLQELGRYYYHRKLEPESFGESYQQLDNLKEGLADNHKTSKRRPDFDLKPEESGIAWSWILGLFIVAMLVVYSTRTPYYKSSEHLSDLAQRLPIEANSRIYADLSAIDNDKALNDFPAMTILPGGSAIFRGLNRNDLQQYMVLRNEEGLVLACGLKFQKQLARFGSRLTQAGWRYISTHSNWETLESPDEQWIWILLSQRECLLLPKTELASFDAMTLERNILASWIRVQFDPFDNNHSLLQGYDQVALILNANQCRIQLNTSKALIDLPQRKRYLDHLMERRKTAKPILTFKDDSLLLNIPAAEFKNVAYSAEAIKNFVSSRVKAWEHNGTPVAQSPDIGTDQGPQLRVYLNDGQKLQPQLGRALPALVNDLDYLDREQCLMVAYAQGLAKLKRSDLSVSQEIRFQDLGSDESFASFNAGQLVLSPDEKFALVLPSAKSKTTHLVLVRSNDLNAIVSEELPRGIAEVVSATWSRDGQYFFLGCRSKPTRRGDSVRAVLVYRMDGGNHRLTRFVELPKGRGSMAISSLAHQKNSNYLQMIQVPQQELITYNLNDDQPMAHTPFGRSGASLSGEWLPRLVFNRTESQVLVLEHAERAENLRTIAYLLNIEEPRAKVMGSLDLGYQPYEVLRQPFRDAFWVSAEQQQALGLIEIDNGAMKGQVSLQLKDFKPQHLAMDQWGQYLFASGHSPVTDVEVQ